MGVNNRLAALQATEAELDALEYKYWCVWVCHFSSLYAVAHARQNLVVCFHRFKPLNSCITLTVGTTSSKLALQRKQDPCTFNALISLGLCLFASWSGKRQGDYTQSGMHGWQLARSTQSLPGMLHPGPLGSPKHSLFNSLFHGGFIAWACRSWTV